VLLAVESYFDNVHFERIVRLLASTAYYANPLFFSLSLLNEDGSNLNKIYIISKNVKD
jgi:hypothetical protein